MSLHVTNNPAMNNVTNNLDMNFEHQSTTTLHLVLTLPCDFFASAHGVSYLYDSRTHDILSDAATTETTAPVTPVTQTSTTWLSLVEVRRVCRLQARCV